MNSLADVERMATRRAGSQRPVTELAERNPVTEIQRDGNHVAVAAADAQSRPPTPRHRNMQPPHDWSLSRLGPVLSGL